jgi:hypothetical protein
MSRVPRSLRPLRPQTALAAIVLAMGALLPPLHDARADEPGTSATRPGYELALFGTPEAHYGGTLRVRGIAYEVRGLAELVPLAQGEVLAELTSVRDPRTGARSTVTSRTVTPGAGARFDVALEVPEQALVAPQLEVRVRRRSAEGRTFTWPLTLGSPLTLDLLTDRALYEPGEPIRVWARLVRTADGAPVGGRAVTLSVHGPGEERLAERIVTTSAAGLATLALPLPTSAAEGPYRVGAQALEGVATASAMRGVRVGRRTVERLLVEATLDQAVVPPSGTLSGRVAVRTPSGAAVRGARVTVRVAGRDEPLALTTDATGTARFRTTAPAFLQGDLATGVVDVEVVHPAHGALRTRATYQLARVEWIVAATPASGGLVPEVDTELFLAVSDPRGRPAPAETAIVAKGPGVRGGSQQATVDAHGLAVVPMRLPRGAAATLTGGGAGCAGQVATLVEVTIATARPLTARVCVRVAPEAQVGVRAKAPVVAVGGEVGIDVQRRDAARGRPVLVEALAGTQTVGAVWLEGAATEGTLALAPGLAGLVRLRARALSPENVLAPPDEPTLAGTGAGALDAVLVRPADAFALRIETEEEPAQVRARARVTLRTDAPREGWAALVARDLAAHGGETPWSLAWLGGVLQTAAADPGAPGSERALRAALAATLSPDSEPGRPPALVPRPGTGARWYAPQLAEARGQLRDPVALRGDLLRRGVAIPMLALERALDALDGSEAARRGLVAQTASGIDFDSNALAHVVERGMLAPVHARTLGDTPLTVALLKQADASFTFDTVARRVTRARLVRLLLALARLGNPDDENAARAAAGEPPERWLSTLVRLGLVPASTLVDAWGRPFAFRRATTGAPALVVAQVAPGWECVSAGPDGRFGTGDDVRDPFARAVPRGTPYAVASGEDALMGRLAALGPGARVLLAMAEAYDAVALATREEARRGVVSATVSEEMPAPSEGYAGEMAADEVFGEGGSGGGMGMGRGMASRRAMPAMAPPPAPAAPGARMRAEQDGTDGDDARNASEARPSSGGSRLATMGELVRERFPATLFVADEVALARDGATVVDVQVADALTTYVVEAIAWTRSGWTTSAAGELRVDQAAMVDAPVPPFATVGDVLRLPVRLTNRTRRPLEARVEVAAEGGLGVTTPGPQTVTVPPEDSVELPVEVRVGGEGEGSLVIRAVRASDGSPLDAVRRPLRVWADARRVTRSDERLLEGEAEFVWEQPAGSSARGPGELRVTAGDALFGDVVAWGEAGHADAAAWARLVGGRTVPESLRAGSRAWLAGEGDDDLANGWDLGGIARAVGVAWSDAMLGDARLRAGMRALGAMLDAEGPDPRPRPIDEERVMPPGGVDPTAFETHARALAMLTPALRAAARRPAIEADLRRLVGRLRARVATEGAALSEAPARAAMGAAALTLTATPGTPDARARELLRRAERGVVTVGTRAFLDVDDGALTTASRVGPTAWLTIARAQLAGRDEALAPLRTLIAQRQGVPRWDDEARMVASAALALVAGREGARGVRVRVDGADVAVREEPHAAVAVLETIARPGAHRVTVTAAPGSLALALLEVRYGLPWDARPARRAPIDLALDGETGPRDGRAGLALTVKNRGARVLSSPIVEVDLPAGAELDEPARERLTALTATAPALDGRTLRLRLRPLAPGGFVRVPLPVRFSTGGALRGLGVTAWDDASEAGLEGPPLGLLPSRTVTIADRGAVPAEARDAASPPPAPPPPPPPPPEPIPLPRIRPLAPVSALPRPAPQLAEVTR